MIAPLPAAASVLGLVVEDGLTVNTTFAAAASFYECLAQTFKRFKVTNKLANSASTVAFTIDCVKSEWNPRCVVNR